MVVSDRSLKFALMENPLKQGMLCAVIFSKSTKEFWEKPLEETGNLIKEESFKNLC